MNRPQASIGSEWQAALHAPNRLADCLDIIACNKVCSACGKASRWRQALLLAFAICRRDVQATLVTHNTITSACEKGSAWIHALRFRLQARSIALQTDTISLNSAASACQKAGKWKSAIALLAELPCLRIRGDTISYNAAYTACANTKWQQASFLVEAVQGLLVEPTTPTYNVLLLAWCRSTQWRPVFQALECLYKRGLRLSEVTPSITIDTCEKTALWQCTLDLLVGFITADVPINIISSGSSISACEKAEQWRHSQMLLTKFQTQSLRVNMVVCSAVVAGYANGLQWEKAVLALMANGANSVRVNLQACSAALHACQRGQLWTLALHLAAPQPKLDMAAISTIAGACGTASKWQPALSILLNVQPSFPSDSILMQNAMLLIAHARSRCSWQRVLLLFTMYSHSCIEPSAASYNAATFACEIGNQGQIILQLLTMLSGAAVGTMHQHRRFAHSNENLMSRGSVIDCSTIAQMNILEQLRLALDIGGGSHATIYADFALRLNVTWTPCFIYICFIYIYIYIYIGILSCYIRHLRPARVRPH